jgi:Fe-S cluster assembly scaffold protein SufB
MVSEAIKEHPELVRKFRNNRASKDNYYAALNSAVFSDGSFVISGVRCPMELSTTSVSIKQEQDSSREHYLLLTKAVMCHT